MPEPIFGDYVLIVDDKFEGQNADLQPLLHRALTVVNTSPPEIKTITIKRHIMGIATLCGHKEFGSSGRCAEMVCFNYASRRPGRHHS